MQIATETLQGEAKAMSKIPEIVMTGGPCGGKTSSLSYLSEKLTDKGFRVFCVPEVATMLILSGLKDIGEIVAKDPELYFETQKAILVMQQSLRNHYLDLAKNFQNPVILYDRGMMDVKAYIKEHLWGALLQELNMNQFSIKQSYDAVIHMVTAADGAMEAYTVANNNARREGVEEAIGVDRRTQGVWIGHPHLKIIDNSTDFNGKLKRALTSVYRALKLPIPIEIERKFLLTKKEAEKLLEIYKTEASSIEQIYIDNADNEEELRIRCKSQGFHAHYYLTRKQSIPGIKRSEIEKIISPTDYERMKKRQKSGTEIIRKERHCFIANNQHWELDVFLEPSNLKGLYLLEIELTEENDQFKLPNFIKNAKEVTDDRNYRNSRLATCQ